MAVLADLVGLGNNRRGARGSCRVGCADPIAQTAGPRHRNDRLIIGRDQFRSAAGLPRTVRVSAQAALERRGVRGRDAGLAAGLRRGSERLDRGESRSGGAAVQAHGRRLERQRLRGESFRPPGTNETPAPTTPILQSFASISQSGKHGSSIDARETRTLLWQGVRQGPEGTANVRPTCRSHSPSVYAENGL